MMQHLMMAILLPATLRGCLFHFFIVVVLLMQIFQMPVGQYKAGGGEQRDQDDQDEGKRAHGGAPFHREDAISIG